MFNSLIGFVLIGAVAAFCLLLSHMQKRRIAGIYEILSRNGFSAYDDQRVALPPGCRKENAECFWGELSATRALIVLRRERVGSIYVNNVQIPKIEEHIYLRLEFSSAAGLLDTMKRRFACVVSEHSGEVWFEWATSISSDSISVCLQAARYAVSHSDAALKGKMNPVNADSAGQTNNVVCRRKIEELLARAPERKNCEAALRIADSMTRDYHDTKSHPALGLDQHIAYCELSEAEARFVREHTSQIGMRGPELVKVGIPEELLRSYGVLDKEGCIVPDSSIWFLYEIQAPSWHILCFVVTREYVDLDAPGCNYS
jgi:hypothetical protein